MARQEYAPDRSGIEISFELFPPRSADLADRFAGALSRLARLQPDFFTITYGAGGSNKSRSLDAVGMLTARVDVPVAAHLTCVGASRHELQKTVGEFLNRGVARFVALRGDPPTGVGTRYVPHADGYADTAHLVADMKRLGATDVSVSAYPERHPESPDWAHEIGVLKRKADAGADRAITQFFFDNDDYERLRDRVVAAGISIPVVPGILPIHNINKVRQFAGKCGASIPDSLQRRFENVEPDTEVHASLSVEFAEEQVEDLKARGVCHFHVYTMNEAGLTESVFGSSPSTRPSARNAPEHRLRTVNPVS